MKELDAEEMKEIMDRVGNSLRSSKTLAKEAPQVSFGCIACEVGLNTAAGAAIAAIIVAGVAVAPEAAAVVAIAEACGLEAATVAAIINGALASGGVATVESIIYELCVAMKACS